MEVHYLIIRIKKIKTNNIKKLLRGGQLKVFLDFDKYDEIFYSNLYLDDVKLVVKVPITNKRKAKKEVTVDNFDLVKYTYLCACKS